MGKGGVGKTSVATGLALALSSLNREVHLTTTTSRSSPPPGLPGALPASLAVEELDPVLASENYRARSLQAARSKGLDGEQLAQLAEDLKSPCYEEVRHTTSFLGGGVPCFLPDCESS